PGAASSQSGLPEARVLCRALAGARIWIDDDGLFETSDARGGSDPANRHQDHGPRSDDRGLHRERGRRDPESGKSLRALIFLSTNLPSPGLAVTLSHPMGEGRGAGTGPRVMGAMRPKK